MVKLTAPSASDCTALYAPFEIVTDPVGVGFPLPPLTEMLMLADCSFVML
jgi:hypothetical protein